MKKGYILLGILGLYIFCSSPQKEPDSKILENDREKFSYAIGVELATTMKEIKQEVDPSIVARGLVDKLNGTDTLLNSLDAKMIKDKIFKRLHAEKRNEQKKQEELIKEKYAQNIKDNSEFLSKNKEKPGVKVTSSGLQYKVIKPGKGPNPHNDSRVKIHYRGTLINGKEFSSSYGDAKPLEINIDDVIKGWGEGLQMMKRGSKYQFFIPPNLAYGQEGSGSLIPPFAVLIFEVELLNIAK